LSYDEFLGVCVSFTPVRIPLQMKNPPANFWRWAERLKLIETRRSASPRQMTQMHNTDSSGISSSFGSGGS